MSAEITILHPRDKSPGDLVRQWSVRGYTLSNHRGRIVARRSVVVEMRRRRAGVEEMFTWLSSEEMK